MPQITSFEPDSGTVGTEVTFQGQDLSLAQTVTFYENVQAQIVRMAPPPNDTYFSVEVPDRAQTGQITIAFKDGTSWTSPEPFGMEYDPQINGFEPPQGSVGTQVTFDGQDLSVVQSVTFAGGAMARPSEIAEPPDDTWFTVAVPQGAQTGQIEVQFRTGQTLTPGDFTVV